VAEYGEARHDRRWRWSAGACDVRNLDGATPPPWPSKRDRDPRPAPPVGVLQHPATRRQSRRRRTTIERNSSGEIEARGW